MPHLDYLTYFSQIFWFLFFFWLNYFLFFFIFLPKIYKSFRIRKLKTDFLFNKFILTDYKFNFYNFFYKTFLNKASSVFYGIVKTHKTKINLFLFYTSNKTLLIKFYFTVYLIELFLFYWSKGFSKNFTFFLKEMFFINEEKLHLIRKYKNDYFLN